MINSSADTRKLLIVPHLKEIIESDISYIKELPNNTQHPNVRAYYRLIAPIILDGKMQDVSIVIREDNNGKLYYNHRLFEDGELNMDVAAGCMSLQAATTQWATNASKDIIG